MTKKQMNSGTNQLMNTQTIKKKRRINKWAVFYSIVLTAYTIFTLLYTFVIPRDVVKMSDIIKENSGTDNSYIFSDNVGESSNKDYDDVNEGNEDISQDNTESRNIEREGNIEKEENIRTDNTEPVVTSNSYESSTLAIKIDTIRKYDTDIYVADIKVKNSANLLSGLAKDSFGRNVTEKTSDIAKYYDAIFAVNGDYYGFRDTGYVMRNGYLYRTSKRSGDDNEDLVVYEDGSFEIVKEAEVSAEELEKKGAVQIYSFGPGLIINGELAVGENDEVAQSMNSNPRTAIGMVEPLHYIVVVSDGRTNESEGLTLYELAQVMSEYGCTQAYNLDGGGSSTMWFNGEIINHPTSHGKIKERSVSDIVYFK